MHFFTDLFWEQLDKIVYVGTKFLFNLVLPTTKSEWIESDSFLKIVDDQVIYKFEWVHNEIKREPFISEEKLMNQLKKSNWKIINKHSVNSKHELSNFYTWFLIEKI
jgi:hypothetical protein